MRRCRALPQRAERQHDAEGDCGGAHDEHLHSEGRHGQRGGSRRREQRRGVIAHILHAGGEHPRLQRADPGLALAQQKQHLAEKRAGDAGADHERPGHPGPGAAARPHDDRRRAPVGEGQKPGQPEEERQVAQRACRRIGEACRREGRGSGQGGHGQIEGREKTDEHQLLAVVAHASPAIHHQVAREAHGEVLGKKECRHQRDDHGQRPTRHRHISQHIGRRGQGAHVAGHSFEIGIAERLGIVSDEIPQLARGECGIARRLIVAHAVLFGFGRSGGLGSA